jgi:hypothetical protein
MLAVSNTRLGDVCDVERIEDRGALAALAASRIVSVVLKDARVSLATLPLPAISSQFEMQLEVLWRLHQTPGADRQAIAGAIDRIVAELYHLTTNDLMMLESPVSS